MIGISTIFLSGEIAQVGAALAELDQAVGLALGIDAIEHAGGPVGHQIDSGLKQLETVEIADRLAAAELAHRLVLEIDRKQPAQLLLLPLARQFAERGDDELVALRQKTVRAVQVVVRQPRLEACRP